MTKALTFTKAQIRRAIQAAKAEGYQVKGIRPDGVVLLNMGDNSLDDVSGSIPVMQDSAPALATSWDDV